jgi:hypothetical protein
MVWLGVIAGGVTLWLAAAIWALDALGRDGGGQAAAVPRCDFPLTVTAPNSSDVGAEPYLR